ncbi:Asp23/Gls24 family envelope stress response protein [Actinopolyspora erythraea]|uniref:Asp23/Gls24 family envelope stress response protein n=1 Tax=Actinopolyspora erythraea TaxID=414996 RepID=A0A223RXH6_9ACTN|nr:Asp23/Gls24 family envelope stress response protein [Actinopolyspora erythraea]
MTAGAAGETTDRTALLSAAASASVGSAPAGRPTPAHHGHVPPEERGVTTLHDRVVERMAARIAGEVDQVGGAAHRVLGVSTGGDEAEQTPQVTAEVHGRMCALRVRLSVDYPAPVAQVTDHVRQVLTDRLAELADVRVRTVDITVTALRPPRSARREIR